MSAKEGKLLEGNALVRELSSLMLCMRIFGATPLSVRDRSLQLRILSPSFLYYLVLSVSQLLAASFFCYRAIGVARSRDDGSLLASFVFLSTLFVPFLLPLLMGAQADEQSDFFALWNRFQAAFECRLNSPLKLNLKRRTDITVTIGVLVSILSLFSKYLVMHRWPSFDNYLQSLASIQLGCLIYAWHATCSALTKVSLLLFQDFEKTLRGSEKPTTGRDASLLELRSLWLQHSQLIVRSCSSIAMTQFTIVVYSFAVVLGLLYQMVGSEDQIVVVAFAMIAGFYVIILVFICMSAHYLAVQIYRDRFAALRLMRIGIIHEKTRQMMLRFFTQMLRICPPVSFNGYITVGRGLLSTLFGALVTNLAVLVQLRIQQRSFNAIEFFNFGEYLQE